MGIEDPLCAVWNSWKQTAVSKLQVANQVTSRFACILPLARGGGVGEFNSHILYRLTSSLSQIFRFGLRRRGLSSSSPDSGSQCPIPRLGFATATSSVSRRVLAETPKN